MLTSVINTPITFKFTNFYHFQNNMSIFILLSNALRVLYSISPSVLNCNIKKIQITLIKKTKTQEFGV